jgi:hypothetical protein
MEQAIGLLTGDAEGAGRRPRSESEFMQWDVGPLEACSQSQGSAKQYITRPYRERPTRCLHLSIAIRVGAALWPGAPSPLPCGPTTPRRAVSDATAAPQPNEPTEHTPNTPFISADDSDGSCRLRIMSCFCANNSGDD